MTLFSWIVINTFGQTDKISKDFIIDRFSKGDLIIINNWVLNGPSDFFDSVMISQDCFKATKLNQDSAKIKFRYFGERFTIYELSTTLIDSITYGYFIDAKVLKYLNPEKEMFYLINGAPCWKFSNALDLIVNKKIIEIQEVEIDQATAIWGKEGRNGALIINTEKKPNAINIFK